MGHACGKVILLGEHAVVYGVPALAIGLDRGAHATSVVAARAEIEVTALQPRARSTGDETELGAAYLALCHKLSAPAARTKIELEVPAGCGLGASAAMGVAAGRALLQLKKEPERLDTLLSAVDAWEKVFHGNPSGIDAATAARGGCILFSKDRGAQSVELARTLNLAVAVAGPSASTKEMVQAVARAKTRDPQAFDRKLTEIDRLVRTASDCLRRGQLGELGELMNDNQRVLEQLGVSTPQIERACSVATEAGALGAKLTGAGGGGCVVALAADPTPVQRALEQAGFHCFCATVSAFGQD